MKWKEATRIPARRTILDTNILSLSLSCYFALRTTHVRLLFISLSQNSETYGRSGNLSVGRVASFRLHEKKVD